MLDLTNTKVLSGWMLRKGEGGKSVMVMADRKKSPAKGLGNPSPFVNRNQKENC